MITPVTPDQVKKSYVAHPSVIEAFNELLIKNAHVGSRITIFQDQVVKLIKQKIPDLKSEDIFENHMLDFESVFEQYGWVVTYNKPHYHESFRAYWEFRPDTRQRT